MKKILFLPLLQMQSGHHQVAEALMDLLKNHADHLILKKVDLLSYTNKSLEKMITNGYLNWIRYAPETYNLAYKSFFYMPDTKRQSFNWYQPLFLKKMEQLLLEEKPDLLVCTHGFPSRLLSILKKKGKCDIPVINVYTDFFVNSVWGKEGIDAHFVPSQQVKEMLVERFHIPKHRIMVTGIPVHEEITKCSKTYQPPQARPKLLIAGGNSGLGGMGKLLEELKNSSGLDFFVLCGKNKKLYEEIRSWQLAHITPLPYLSSRSAMNQLYEEVDAIMTKPGGVTVSEALHKRLPIFVHSMLPGQEKINLRFLREHKLAFVLDQSRSIEQQLVMVLNNRQQMKEWEKAIDSYQQGMELTSKEPLIETILDAVNQQPKNVLAGAVLSSAVLHASSAQ
ncbi:galactosyldiacylglycerol synthase [Bacillus sp. ISL-18]|uniref:MGDG synthase family glycosyltransferase n=1 Tax=Bacillus sp. ISL-18 TaxID=2819118 RepID=UPI001BE88ABB|nr:galactosyldiacylglycerol synthase [Bacillus sp. ISL-18]MBT2657305.1 galactosyldiacylglycerol synthase [Bacillus sp. ISL-18]